MFLKLFALLMVMPWVLSDKVSTKPGLKMFRDEYKSTKETCLDLGFVKKPCNSGSGIICQFFYIVSEKPDGVIVWVLEYSDAYIYFDGIASTPWAFIDM